MEKISNLLKKFINENIPQKQTNIFWQLFNGIEAAFSFLDLKMNLFKRERNILTAQNVSSLRNLAAQNGFEPNLKIPAKGFLQITVSSKLFNRVGYPVFIPSYAIFTNKSTKNLYYYNSAVSYKVDSNIFLLGVIEGEIKQKITTSNGDLIERVYIDDIDIADKSISVEVNGIEYQQVDSFFDNEGLNENNLFIVKFSSDIQNPIVIYIKNTILNDEINITYRVSVGEFGNITEQNNFEISDLIDTFGNQILVDDDEIQIINYSGFDLGSNGTDVNYLKSSIGYNHGKNLLFDNHSYQNYINKFSSILLQKIELNEPEKTINNIYISKKQILFPTNNVTDIINQYQSIISSKSYLLSEIERNNLSNNISEFEYCLSRHNIFNSDVTKYAFQFEMKNSTDLQMYKDKLSYLVYTEFGKFFYDRYYIINFELLMNNFMMENQNLEFDYMIFNDSENITNNYTIKHDDKLPIILGDFEIIDSYENSVKLFFNMNFVIKN